MGFGKIIGTGVA